MIVFRRKLLPSFKIASYAKKELVTAVLLSQVHTKRVSLYTLDASYKNIVGIAYHVLIPVLLYSASTVYAIF